MAWAPADGTTVYTGSAQAYSDTVATGSVISQTPTAGTSLTRGDTVLAERPTYMGALGAFNAYEPAYADLDGPDVPDGARLASAPPDSTTASTRGMAAVARLINAASILLLIGVVCSQSARKRCVE